jgi:tryptophan 7-halogenase
LERIPGTTVVVDEDDQVRVRPAGGERFLPLPGLATAEEIADFRRLLEAVDGERTVAQVVAALPDLDAGDVLATLETLLGRIFRPRNQPGKSPEDRGDRLVVVGAGWLAGGVARALRAAGMRRLTALDLQQFPGCSTPAFHRHSARVLTPAPVAERPLWLLPQVPLESVTEATATALDPYLIEGGHAALAVVALEATPFQALLDVEAACRELGVPVLFLTVEGGGVTVGPLSLPGAGCLACSRSHRSETVPEELLPVLPIDSVRDAPPLAVQQATARAVLEASRAVAPRPDPRLLLQTLRIAGDGTVTPRSFTPRPDCPLCREEARTRATPLETTAAVRTVTRLFEPRSRQAGQGQGQGQGQGRRAGEDGSVGILGGGAAGYLAALALRRKRPHLRVTVIESPRIPVIGVGEASTPLLPAFLHGTLGIDMHRFFVEARPVWKLGIRFLWGPESGPSESASHFDYPFDRGLLTESYAYQGHGNAYCPSALLMARERSNLIPLDDRGEGYAFLPAPFAYHLDNRRFVAFLQAEAARAGVERRSVEVVGVERGEALDGERIHALRTDNGEAIARDFWIDASGFRSFLLGQTLGTEFLSFAASLPTDAALAAPRPRGAGETLRPFTIAETMDHGWSWRIALPEEDHLGYVFSTAFCSPDEAAAEFRRHHPGLGEPRLIPFRCGRLADAWRGNVFALGNAYGFVEPLESTALHMVLVGIDELIRHLPADFHQDEPETRRQVNRRLGEQWDHLRGFLALHFRHNHRRDTPFWRHCRDLDPGLGSVAESLFAERGPLSARPCPVDFDPLWGDFGRDVLLLGQWGLKGTRSSVPPTVPETEWRRILARGEALAARALPFPQATQVLERRPDLLRRLQHEAPWLQENRS